MNTTPECAVPEVPALLSPAFEHGRLLLLPTHAGLSGALLLSPHGVPAQHSGVFGITLEVERMERGVRVHALNYAGSDLLQGGVTQALRSVLRRNVLPLMVGAPPFPHQVFWRFYARTGRETAWAVDLRADGQEVTQTLRLDGAHEARECSVGAYTVWTASQRHSRVEIRGTDGRSLPRSATRIRSQLEEGLSTGGSEETRGYFQAVRELHAQATRHAAQVQREQMRLTHQEIGQMYLSA